MRRFVSLFGLSLALLATPVAAQESTWEIDPAHSGAHFSVRHMMIATVRGEFTKLSGAVRLNEEEITRSSVEATIDATTIHTREEGRDRHLRSADFLDVEKFPTITFKSSGVEKSGPGKLKVSGDLTIHGVTRQVVLDVDGPTDTIKDQRGNLRAGATATTTINRKDFGLTWNRALETGGVVVGDEVKITIDLELVKRAPQP